MLLNPELAKQFHQDGFLRIENGVNQQERDRLVLRMRELAHRRCENSRAVFETGEANHSGDEFFLRSAQNISFFFDKNARHDGKSTFSSLNKVGHALHDLCPVFSAFSHQAKFYDLMRLLGHEKPLLVQSMFIFKQAHFGDEVPAHQDATFIYTEPSTVIGLWFALEDADENNGCLWVIAGGHKGPLKNRFCKSSSGLKFNYHEKVRWPRELFKPVRARAGDMVVLHGHLPHLSEVNRSAKTRFAYTTHFVDQKAHYAKTNWLAFR